MTHIDFIQNII